MNRGHEKSRVIVPWVRRRGVPLMVIAISTVVLQAGECEKSQEYFVPVGITLGGGAKGDISGTFTVDGGGRSGVTVTLRQGGSVIATTTTEANGDYEFSDLDPGNYTISLGTLPGASCPGDQSTVVVADDVTEVDFACTSQPTTGTVSGMVTGDGSPVADATVELDGRTTTTDATGMFTFTNVTPGPYGVNATVSGFQCLPQTTTVSAGQISTVTIPCISSPSGNEIAANPYSLSGAIVGADGCGLGNSISNPGPITVLVDVTGGSTFLTIVSDADVRGMYLPGQPWIGSGESTISSGGMSFLLRETTIGTWQRSGGLVMLPASLTFEIFSGSTKMCESRYDASYQAAQASSHRFKQGVRYLLPKGNSIMGLRPVAYRYRSPHGDPAKPRIGLIAEDVVRVFPAAVARDDKGRPMGIAYGILRRQVFDELADRARKRAESGIGWMAGIFDQVRVILSAT